MKHIINKKWVTGGEVDIDFYELLNLTREYVKKGSKIFIGSDSFIYKKKVCFATAICLHGGQNGGRYFFYKETLPDFKYSHLVARITEETTRSVEIACLLMDEYGIAPRDIELHLDVSPFNTNNATSKYSDMLKGYVKGFGVDYRLKPDAWASQTVADKHSK